jgi:imidazolonepropionase-like amidohydrolase
VTAIVGATVVHPELEGAAARASDRTLILSGQRIKAVGPAASTAVPAGARVIDAHGKWVIPGLIDSHVHFFQSANLFTRPDVVDLNAFVPYAQEVKRNTTRLPLTFRVWLARGVTGVADVGGPFWNFKMRAAARASDTAPRVAATGPLISMVDRPQLDLGDPPIIKITSPPAARELVRRELAYKPDFIKVWYIHRPGDDLAAQEAIVRATAEAAHAAGLRLAVHATELETAKSALRAGADFLVHSVQDAPVDEEFIALARARHILYCPTLFVYMGYGYALSGTWQRTRVRARASMSMRLPPTATRSGATPSGRLSPGGVR